MSEYVCVYLGFFVTSLYCCLMPPQTVVSLVSMDSQSIRLTFCPTGCMVNKTLLVEQCSSVSSSISSSSSSSNICSSSKPGSQTNSPSAFH
ncbi:hypothetical protein DOY81_002080 [Sarcophaga bullata]|nr:hypothetical protein DOY81_002080 [Sarcophaga bullata]